MRGWQQDHQRAHAECFDGMLEAPIRTCGHLCLMVVAHMFTQTESHLSPDFGQWRAIANFNFDARQSIPYVKGDMELPR